MVTIEGITTEEESATNFLTGGVGFDTIACVGEQVDVEAEGQSFADDTIRGRLVILDVTRENAIIFDSRQVSSGEEIEELWETTIPASALGGPTDQIPPSVEAEGSLEFWVVAQEFTDGEWQTTHSDGPEQIGVFSVDARIDAIEAPDSLCQGEDLQVSVTVANISECRSDFRARFTSDVLENMTTDAVDLRPGDSTTFTFEQNNVPGRGANINASIEAVGGGGSTQVASQPIEVNLLPIEFSLAGVEIPQGVCFGNNFDIEGTLRNSGNCSAQARVRLSPSGRDDKVTESAVIQPNQSRDFSFTIQNMPETSMTVNVIAEIMEEGIWREINRDSQNVSTLFGDLDIQTASYPDTLRPGDDGEASITIKNNGDCATDFNLSGTLLDTVTGTLESGEAREITQTFTINVIEQDINLELLNTTRNQQADTFNTSVRAKQAIFIDTDEGVTIIGGFNNSVGYGIAVQGTDLSTEDFDDVDRARVGRRKRVGSAQGSASPDISNIDKFNLTNLDYLNGLVDREVVWVIDNEIIEITQSFKYTIYPFGVGETGLPAPATDPEVVVRVRPRDLIGRLRNRLNA